MAAKKAKEKSTKTDNGIDVALSAIRKSYGIGSVMRGIDQNQLQNITRFSSGCYSIDKALGGGWAEGRIIEVYGPESSGKTTLCLHAIAELQKAGKTCALIDIEHALDPEYATNLGVDLSTLILAQPSSGEEALNITDMLARSGAVNLLVIDSVAALVPEAELKGEMGDSHVGLQARLMNQALRKLTGICHKNNVTIIFINQIRMKIGVMFGSPETRPGGEGLKFYASQRVDVRRVAGIKDKDSGDDTQFVGNRTRIKVVKNKTAAPFKQCEFTINYGTGIDKEQDLLENAVQQDVVDKNGAWFAYEGKNFAQGAANAAQHLRENPEFLDKIKSQLK